MKRGKDVLVCASRQSGKSFDPLEYHFLNSACVYLAAAQMTLPFHAGDYGSGSQPSTFGLPLTLTVYKWNQMDPNGSIWFHLYAVRVKGRPLNLKFGKPWSKKL